MAEGDAPLNPNDPTSPETLKSALKAFRKRLKLTRLDAESKLGGGRPVTSGKASGIVAIQPPSQFPRSVWDELAKQGKLKYTGNGFFELLEP
jgi:hypothetical protein